MVRMTLYSLTCDIIFYLEKPTDSGDRLLEPVRELSKITEYEVDLFFFFSISNSKSENRINNNTSFPLSRNVLNI